jgi:hypothetical protein
MDTLHQALGGAQHTPQLPLQVLQALLVVGGGGTLGSAVLAQALVAGRFARVQALVSETLASTVRGFQPLHVQVLQAGGPDADGSDVATAVVVFERQRQSNGRDDAFVHPDPTELPALALQLHRRGVRRLLVVVPHAPALLPQALSHGLASLDEAAVAALGFEQLVFLRASQSTLAAAQGSRLERFAAWWLSQLAWMVPQRQQPVRAAVLARCVVQLARLLPLLAQGTRVIAPETLWHWAQQEEALDVTLARELGLALEPAGTQTDASAGAPAD